MDMEKSKLYFWYDLFKKTLSMHLLVLPIFGRYCIRHILCGHSKVSKYFSNLTIFPRNISIILSKYFGAMWVDTHKIWFRPAKILTRSKS